MIRFLDKRLQHVLVPVTVLTLGLQEIGLYTLLAHWATVEDSPESEAAMAKRVGVSVNTIRKYLGVLEEKGFLTITLNTKTNEAGEQVHDGTPMELALIDQTPLLPKAESKPKKKSMTAEQHAYMSAFSPDGERFLEPEFLPAAKRLFGQWKKVQTIFKGQDLSRLNEFITWFNTESPLAKRGKSAWGKYCNNQAHAPICALTSPERFAEAFVRWLNDTTPTTIPDHVKSLMSLGMDQETAMQYTPEGARAYIKLKESDYYGMSNM